MVRSRAQSMAEQSSVSYSQETLFLARLLAAVAGDARHLPWATPSESLSALRCGRVAIGSRCLIAASASVGLTIGICLSVWTDPLNFSGATALLCPKYHPAPPTIIKTAIATAMRIALRDDGGEICAVAVGLSLSA